MSDLNANIPLPNAPLLRPDGRIAEVWWRFFLQLFNRTGGSNGTDPGVVFVGLDVDAPLAIAPQTEQIGLETLHAMARDSSAGLAPADILAASLEQQRTFDPLMGVGSQDTALEPMIFACSQGHSAQAAASVVVTTSPMSFLCTERAALHVAGGTVSALSYQRGAVSMALDVAATGQLIELSSGDVLEITYSSAPTLTLIPR